MKKALALAAVAGLASVAAAQSLTLNISADRATANVGDTITYTVSANTAASTYILNVNVHFVASDAGLGSASAFSWNSWASATNNGNASGASLDNVRGGQSLLFGAIDGSNPIVLGTFTVTAGAEGELSYGVVKGTAAASAMFITQRSDQGPFGPQFTFASATANGFSLNADSVRIIPAPGAMALLGLGGLAAARRRR
jgi:conserved repeat domain